MDKVTVENRGGAWINDRKTADWQDDYKGKMYVAKPGMALAWCKGADRRE